MRAKRRFWLFWLGLLVACQPTAALPVQDTPVLSASVTPVPPLPRTATPSRPTVTPSLSTRQPALPEVTIALGAPVEQPLRPLLGINIGPLPAGEAPHNADLTAAYHQIGVTLIRTHDFYGPLDMAVMYPDRRRDPADPQSYDFSASDRVWQAMVTGGFEPYLRLGDSWNNATPPANEQERAHWVRAAVEVVRHYRAGQWNGFTTPFRYVEIWNEPDNQQFWPRPHTPQDYFQLYVETARALKQAFPDLQVGGPGLTQAGVFAPHGARWLREFLGYLRQQDAPLDFFSWHLYANEPEQWVTAARFYRAELAAQGFGETPMHVTEWNTEVRPGSQINETTLALRTGGQGAAILTAAWIAMQQEGIAEATIYRGPDPDVNMPIFYGLFYADGRPKRSALAFSLWAQLSAYPQRLAVTATPTGTLWLLAGQNAAGERALLMANPTATMVRYTLGDAGQPATLLQVNDAAEEVQRLPVAETTGHIEAATVQLLLWPQP